MVKDINNDFLPFVEGNSYELGLKSALFDNKLNLATAIFRMKEENIPYYYTDIPINPNTGTYYRCTPVTGDVCNVQYASDGPTISGFEITAQGQITPKWLINSGYTYLHVDQPVDGEIRKNYTSSMLSGDYSFERPKHAINLSTSYQIIDDLTIGGSVRWKSKTTQKSPSLYINQESPSNSILSQGSYSVVDIMSRYKITSNIMAGLNINNIFNKEYKHNNRASLYGQPRSATVSLNFKF